MNTKSHRILLAGIIGIGLLTAALPPALAQTNTAPVPTDEGSFLSTVGSYFTSFNTNLSTTFTNKGAAWAGVDSNIGGGKAPPVVNELGVSYAIAGAFAGEVVLRNGGVAGVVDSLQGGVDYSIVLVDTKLGAYLDGGYSWDNKKAYGEIGVRVMKALTTHTFAYVNYGVQVTGTSGSPPQVIGGGVGFTF